MSTGNWILVGLGLLVLTVGTVVVILIKNHGTSGSQREPTPRGSEKSEKKEKVQRKEVEKKVHRLEVSGLVPLLGTLAVIVLVWWLTGIFSRSPTPGAKPAETTTTVVAEADPAPAVPEPEAVPTKAGGCDQAGKTVRVSAPLTRENERWSPWVWVHAQCTPTPSIPPEARLYRYRCLDRYGKGPFVQESGKCDGGVIALQFQKLAPLREMGEKMPEDEYWADLPLDISFTEYSS